MSRLRWASDRLTGGAGCGRSADGKMGLFSHHHRHRRSHHQCQRRADSKYLGNFALYKLNFFNHNRRERAGQGGRERQGWERASPTPDGNNMTIMTLLTETTSQTYCDREQRSGWRENSIQFVQLKQNLKSVLATSECAHRRISNTLVDIYRSTHQYVMCKRISNRYLYSLLATCVFVCGAHGTISKLLHTFLYHLHNTPKCCESDSSIFCSLFLSLSLYSSIFLSIHPVYKFKTGNSSESSLSCPEASRASGQQPPEKRKWENSCSFPLNVTTPTLWRAASPICPAVHLSVRQISASAAACRRDIESRH